MSLLLNNFMWVIWYLFVVTDKSVLLENGVSIFCIILSHICCIRTFATYKMETPYQTLLSKFFAPPFQYTTNTIISPSTQTIYECRCYENRIQCSHHRRKYKKKNFRTPTAYATKIITVISNTNPTRQIQPKQSQSNPFFAHSHVHALTQYTSRYPRNTAAIRVNIKI